MLPKYRSPTHPGEMLLKEFIEPLNIKQSDLANKLGLPDKHLDEIINCRRNITADIATELGKAFGTGQKFWLNLQRDWDLWHG